MSRIAKTKKLKLSKIDPADSYQFLVTRYLLYLRGEEVPKFNGIPVDPYVEWRDDGTFKPTEEGIASTFKFIDNLWRRIVRRRFKKEAWPKYDNLFKQAIAKEWEASKTKSTPTATESQS